ncbi:type III-B CRISPR module-associated protein Cmr5 [Acinetobacter johnsonii]|jgi:CRISPR-associated protein Cmr5|uniref:type III-B CRISPR module-associated protein Cmr5 n=1 Tax=Acinetobacter johnsonii TaxID=40214 RepID=UPI00281013C8|nr:type III-B CRISPR module-associated protein Cmr5 [Acinetobacter johnsonii]MDQ8975264.1 type III-B CRISPR module-associated protein Cmr5 [Acinetobacter johnsonii]
MAKNQYHNNKPKDLAQKSNVTAQVVSKVQVINTAQQHNIKAIDVLPHETGVRTQRYALKAYPKIDFRKGKDIEAKYRTIALDFPTLVLQGGLAQAVGFLLAKNNPEHQAYLEDLAEVLNIPTNDQNIRRQRLHHNVIYADIAEYQLLTRKALEASAWLKRYTQSLLKGAE